LRLLARVHDLKRPLHVARRRGRDHHLILVCGRDRLHPRLLVSDRQARILHDRIVALHFHLILLDGVIGRGLPLFEMQVGHLFLTVVEALHRRGAGLHRRCEWRAREDRPERRQKNGRRLENLHRVLVLELRRRLGHVLQLRRTRNGGSLLRHLLVLGLRGFELRRRLLCHLVLVCQRGLYVGLRSTLDLRARSEARRLDGLRRRCGAGGESVGLVENIGISHVTGSPLSSRHWSPARAQRRRRSRP